MWFLKVIAHLKKQDVRFAAAGGYAVALHGAVRGTMDIDLVVATDESNLSKLESALGELGLKSRIPVSAKEIANFREEFVKRRNLIAWSFVDANDPSHLVDAIIAFDFRARDIVQIKVHGEAVPVLSKRALIAMKEKAGREQDIEDARALRDLDEKD